MLGYRVPAPDQAMLVSGGRRWRILHRAIYISAVCGVIHYYWLVKSAVIRPITTDAVAKAN